MRLLALPVCLLMVAVGGIFLGQGVGLIPGSFMTGSATWAVIGAVMVVVGVGLLLVAARRPEP
jgi:hypothetical protein